MSESKLQGKMIRYLSAKGAYTVNVVAASKAGVPDIIACYKGIFIGIEVKLEGNKPSALQKANIKLIESSGGVAIVAYSLDDIRLLIEAL